MITLVLAFTSVCVLGLCVATWTVRRKLRVVTVRGCSMEPSLLNGEKILVKRCTASGIRRGDVVFLEMDEPLGWPPGRPILPSSGFRSHIVKRVAALPGERVGADLGVTRSIPRDSVVPAGKLVLLGDNPNTSEDSRKYGYISAAWVTGKMIRKLGS
ncbi:S26 family signal peptidase [Streptosporangium sp. NPDC020072]|uniref:S26 family signal peptidase n=1 Tax=Streptosporangium sp. NPDC020072 TaxID=3154788 RepID=UPI0034496474